MPQFLEEYLEDKGRILFAGFEAPAPDLRNFNWKDFYVRALEALYDPLVDRNDHLFVRTNASHRTKAQLRLLLEKGLQHRQPKLFYVDEAQNLGKVTSGKYLEDQADCIKSISNQGRVPILLVGTYKLIYLKDLNAQLCRRSANIHFPRYRLDRKGDEKAFKNILATFQQHLPVPEEPPLTANWEFCYERSLGCIGILKDWLTHTLADVLIKKEDAKTLTLLDLEKNAHSMLECLNMLREIRKEEQILDEIVEQDTLRIELGLKPLEKTKPEAKNQSTTAKSSSKTNRARVGEPKPQRREIGDTQTNI